MEFSEGKIEGVSIVPLRKFSDDRGWLLESFRRGELDSTALPAMGYTSLTYPGVVRGPHEHEDQTDLFTFLGPGIFKIWLWDNRKNSPTYRNKIVLTAGEQEPKQVLVPPGVVHAYKCISQEPAISNNFPNRLYAGQGKKQAVDEIRYEDDPNTPFKIDG